MKKYLFILIDGLGDVACPDLSYKTPLEAAKTPNILKLLSLSDGTYGLVDPVEPGLACGSDTAHMSLFGYSPRKYYRGRGAFESLGAGLEVSVGDIAFKCNFATIDRSGVVIHRRVDRDFTEEGPILCNYLDTMQLSRDPDITVRVKYATEHRCGICIKGPGLSDLITGTDPLRDGEYLKKVQPKVRDEITERTACVVNEISETICAALENHAINRRRITEGKNPANGILLRGCGTRLNMVPFEEKYKRLLNDKKSFAIAPTCMISGWMKTIGIGVVSKNMELATGDYHTNVNLKGSCAIALLTNSHEREKFNMSEREHSFGFIHIKAVDDAGHDSDMPMKQLFLEKIDAMLGNILVGLERHTATCGDDFCVILTGDHSTPIYRGDHSCDPVPIIISKISRESPSCVSSCAQSVGEVDFYSDDIMIACGLVKCILGSKASITPPKIHQQIDMQPTVVVDSFKPQLRSSRIPTTRVARIYEFGKLAFNLAINEVTSLQASRRRESSVQDLVSSLTRMRGAALKIGQMFSISELEGVPRELQDLMLRLQNNADYMPQNQLDRVLGKELGTDWENHFSHFERVPIAAASIGQVHRATLKSGEAVAVKVQYPNVAESISSDLNNLSMLLKLSKVLPPGLFLENTIKVAKEELQKETDYAYEASSIKRFQGHLRDDNFFLVPKVYDNVSTSKVLTTSFMRGVSLGQLGSEPQRTRDQIAEEMLKLCLKELFTFKFMQTDPNWSYFLYDREQNKISLIDFGASKEFDHNFTDKYRDLLVAATKHNISACVDLSIKLGFLTGDESREMVNAHIDSLIILATPFATPGYFDFESQNVSAKVRKHIPTMLKYRLKPPPNESYSLHRKLSGAFLLCSMLETRVRCQDIFQDFLYE